MAVVVCDVLVSVRLLLSSKGFILSKAGSGDVKEVCALQILQDKEENVMLATTRARSCVICLLGPRKVSDSVELQGIK